MKPDRAVKVDVDCDISTNALLHAEDSIIEELTKLNDNLYPNIQFTIKVPSQVVSIVIPIMYLLKYEIEIDFDYKYDEWSLKGEFLKCSDGNIEALSYEVWSPGA